MTEYDTQVTAFIERTWITITRNFTGTRPAPWSKDGESVDTYSITIERAKKHETPKGKSISFSFDFHDSIHDTEIRKLSPWDIETYNRTHKFQRITRAKLAQKKSEIKNGPTSYTLLACISSESYQHDTLEDFCDNFGYDTDSRKALEIYLACQELSSKITRFFTTAELEALREIQ